MGNNAVALLGIVGVALFFIASILGGFQFDNYSPISQYISETMAVDTPYGKALRFFGYIPSGICLTIFSLAALRKFPDNKFVKTGFYGLAIFYGFATIIVGIFPCDSGCNKEMIDPSVSQIIHNLTGLLTYTFVPASILIIGLGLRKFAGFNTLATVAIICGLITIFFSLKLITDPISELGGLYQRIVEATFIFWIVACSLHLKKHTIPQGNQTD